MARTVVAIYDTFQMANEAVRELVDNGFPRDNISIIANNQRGELGGTTTTPATTRTENVADETGTGAGVGAGIGAAIGGIGGLLVGLGALTIPGIGPVIAAGPLAVALSALTGAGVGAVAGGVTGGLLGALVGLGIPEEEAGFYAEGVRRGGVLVTVQADEYNTDQITTILNKHDPVDINARADEWRTSGWAGYDPNARTIPATGTETDQGLMTQGTSTMDHDRDMLDRDRNRTDRDYAGSMGTPRTDSDYTDRNRTDQNFTDRALGSSGMGQQGTTGYRGPGGEGQMGTGGTSGMGQQGTSGTSGMGQQGMGQQGMGQQGMGQQGMGQQGMGQQGMGQQGMGQQGMGQQGMGQQGMGSYEGFNPESTGYRTFYDTNLFDAGQPYSYYVPAYRYGYNLRNDPRFQGGDWSKIEPQARVDWERENPGTWDRVKNAIRHSWETITD